MKTDRFLKYIKEKTRICGRFVTAHIKELTGVLLAFCAVFVWAIVTMNDDAPGDGEKYGDIITRFPLNSEEFFFGGEPKSAILLSWHDKTLKLDENESAIDKLGAVMYPITIKDRTLIFSSSDNDIAQIDIEGNILVKKPGSVELTVMNEHTGNIAKAFLQVVQPVTGFYLEKSTIDLYTTDTGVRLEGVMLPQNASNTAIKWYSKDTGIVEVDQTGHLKPVNTGMTEVVATTSDGGFTSKCFVNVINKVIKAESVTIVNKEEVTLDIGGVWTGLASVQPANAKNTTVIWESSDESVATVTKTGVVKGVSAGSATITARSADGPFDSIDITVNGSNSAVEIDMNPTYSVSGGINYTAYNMTLDEMVDIQMKTTPKYNDGSGLKYADKNRVRMYVDPNEFCSGAYKYQFMDLSKPNGISRDVLNKFLDGKGILSGRADAFIEAANAYGVSELYLVAHACVETGYGRSELANGVNVNGTRVYNMYGIGAYDSNAVATGSNKAASEGWTSPDAAIKGGAKWISDHYVNNMSERQNTLYKMRWNPDNPGVHLYAGDVSWATTQATILQKLFNELPGAVISYDVPVYAGSNTAEIDTND